MTVITTDDVRVRARIIPSPSEAGVGQASSCLPEYYPACSSQQQIVMDALSQTQTHALHTLPLTGTVFTVTLYQKQILNYSF